MRAPTLRQGQQKKPIHPASWDRLSRNGLYGTLGFVALTFILAAFGHPQAASAATFLAGMVLGISMACGYIAASARTGRLRNFTPGDDVVTTSRRAANAQRSELAQSNPLLPMDDEAVSPVVGVILMVAITVVLAVVVFVLVNNLGKDTPNSVHDASFSSQPATASDLSWRLISQNSAWTWAGCTLKDQAGATADFTVNGAAPADVKSSVGDVVSVSGLTTKTAYDYLMVCEDAAIGHLTGTTL